MHHGGLANLWGESWNCVDSSPILGNKHLIKDCVRIRLGTVTLANKYSFDELVGVCCSRAAQLKLGVERLHEVLASEVPTCAVLFSAMVRLEAGLLETNNEVSRASFYAGLSHVFKTRALCLAVEAGRGDTPSWSCAFNSDFSHSSLYALNSGPDRGPSVGRQTGASSVACVSRFAYQVGRRNFFPHVS